MNRTKLDILAFSAHPDDVELSASGTIIKHIKQGATVGVIDLTRGELGTRGSGELRMEEAKRASEIMGLTIRENLHMADGFFEVTKENIIKVAETIRYYEPDIILCNAIHDRHPDHGRASQLVSEACFYSGLVKVEIERNGENLTRWRPKKVYHYIQDRYLKPDIVVDISNEIDRKMESIMAYASQFYDPTSSEPTSSISSKEFLENVRARTLDFGRLIDVVHGEGFTVERPVAVEDLRDLG